MSNTHVSISSQQMFSTCASARPIPSDIREILVSALAAALVSDFRANNAIQSVGVIREQPFTLGKAPNRPSAMTRSPSPVKSNTHALSRLRKVGPSRRIAFS